MATSTGKKNPMVGACGLDCALCPRFYTEGKSRCGGCGSEYSYAAVGCRLFRCCVRERGLETCAGCDDFPCPKLKGMDASDSFVTHRKMMCNLQFTAEHGIERHLEEQAKRKRLLEMMLEEYDEGRSKSYFCVAATLLPMEALMASLEAAESRAREEGVADGDRRSLARLMREELERASSREGIALTLRKNGKKK